MDPGREELGSEGVAQILEGAVADACPLHDAPPIAGSEVPWFETLEHERLAVRREPRAVFGKQGAMQALREADSPRSAALRGSGRAAARP
ncbi:MAG TPA: hypothetical protein VMR31_19020 [Myxococcota bacterium]|nr:hypothetical protein [Myxococcota bacterium]